MSDPSQPQPGAPAAAAPNHTVQSQTAQPAAMPAQPQPDVTDPAKLIRLGTMLQAVLTELQSAEPDAAGRARLRQIHTEAVEELSEILSEDLRHELLEFNDYCADESSSSSELRVAHAQLVGWVQGLLRGMQATATAQAQIAQQQMMMMQMRAQAQAQGQPMPRALPGQASVPAQQGGEPKSDLSAGYL